MRLRLGMFKIIAILQYLRGVGSRTSRDTKIHECSSPYRKWHSICVEPMHIHPPGALNHLQMIQCKCPGCSCHMLLFRESDKRTK
jgi:hypothetical protein